MQTITIGASAKREIVVTNKMSAIEVGSGDVLVFATPIMIAYMEATSVDAIKDQLDSSETSVGTLVNIRHLAATGLGKTVRIRAEVTAVEGRQVSLTVQAWVGEQLIGDGTHTRVVVDKERFMQRVEAQN
ncbi:MAG: thioesterase family protein [Anaerolineae bacterium]